MQNDLFGWSGNHSHQSNQSHQTPEMGPNDDGCLVLPDAISPAERILKSLYDLGCSVSATADTLHVSLPTGLADLPDPLADKIRAYKPELLILARAYAGAPERTRVRAPARARSNLDAILGKLGVTMSGKAARDTERGIDGSPSDCIDMCSETGKQFRDTLTWANVEDLKIRGKDWVVAALCVYLDWPPLSRAELVELVRLGHIGPAGIELAEIVIEAKRIFPGSRVQAPGNTRAKGRT